MTTDQVQDTETEDQVQDTTNPQDVQDTQAAQSQVDQKLLQEKRRANREAQEAKKRLAEMEAKLQQYEDAEKSEVERAQAEATRAKQELEATKARLAQQERISAVTAAGVDVRYAKFAAGELADAMAENPDILVDDWAKTFREKNPAFFGGNGNGVAAPTGQGGPTSAKPSKIQQAILETKKKLENPTLPSGDRALYLRTLRKLEGQQ